MAWKVDFKPITDSYCGCGIMTVIHSDARFTYRETAHKEDVESVVSRAETALKTKLSALKINETLQIDVDKIESTLTENELVQIESIKSKSAAGPVSIPAPFEPIITKF